MKTKISQFIVEVGRMCTRQCAHCLRGCMEDTTIDVNYAKHILNQVESIGCITFTGGEPALYSKQISEIIDYIVDNHIACDSFYVASNGEIYSHELMTALIKLYAYTLEFGDAEVTALAQQSNAIGFLLPPMEKHQLFRGVISGGVLPRKTFSMGHAREKRYYLEGRKIR